MDARLLKPTDVAERCQISAKSVLRAIHRGELRAYRLGERSAYRIRESDLDAWLELTVVAPPAERPRTAPAPVASLPDRSTTAGRLALTPEMGRRGSTSERAA